jgi:shikimate dehydrogenase
MKFGLIGHPIAHSLSPALFNAGYDGRYTYELIESPDFEEAYEKFLNSYDGINVTAPFKELAFAKADILSDECKAIGATNLLVKTPEGIKAYNSDYLGVRKWLEEVRSSLSSGGGLADTHIKVLVVGLGGAGKAAAEAAGSLGMKVIRMNRTVKDEHTRPLDDFKECFRESDIIIYNIPTSIEALNELSDKDFIPGKAKFILEANYKDPSFDKVMKERIDAAAGAVSYTGGRTWLLYQAVTGYEIFTGEKPDLTKMTDVL